MLLILMTAVVSHAADPVMPVEQILEQTYRDDQVAVVVPDRLEMICEFGNASQWGFAFAAFKTTWRGPITLEVTGSGGYEQHDIFSMAAVTLDYGTKNGWAERSHLGLGLIQGSRSPHPPSWGVGNSGPFAMRGNLLNATPEPQRVTIDPAKYAPKDWDGRLWIGLCIHNVGTGKYLKARIVNALPAGTPGPEPDEQGKRRLMQEHQRSYLTWRAEALRTGIEQAKSVRAIGPPPEIASFAEGIRRFSTNALSLEETEKALRDVEKGVIGAERFLKIVGGNVDPRVTLMSAAKAEADALGQVNACFDTWKKSGRFGNEIGCIIRTATNLEKVGLTDMTSGRIVSAKPEPIRISAARHEYEGFQIVLTPLAHCETDVRIGVSELTGPGGRIPKSEIEINPVGYVRIFQGQLVPDPLLIGGIPKLKPGENQPVWITVRVPDDAPAGEYKGFVRIWGGKSGPLNLPLTLRVRDFAIPHKISLRSSFWMFRDQINRFYGLDEVKLDDYFAWIDMALEHRLCPIDVVEGRCTSLVDAQLKDGTPNPKPDFAAWDRYIDRMIAGGATTIHLGLSHHHGGWFADEQNKVASPEQIRRVIESIRMLRDHYREKGWFDLHYMQLRDETSAPESLNVYREVKKALPDVKLLLTAPSGEARPILDIPCPLSPSYDAGWQREVKEKGGEYWWYVCVAPSDPAWANLFLHQTAAQHRALFWQTWSRGVDGLLYWGLNFWRWYDGKDWSPAMSPNWRVPPADAPNYCPLPDAPGDGFSMYPGPTSSQPLSSIRLENMRDGEEDYEYLLILDRLIAEAERKGTNTPSLAKAKAARDEARKLVASMTDYPRTAAPYLEIRDKIAEAIEALGDSEQ